MITVEKIIGDWSFMGKIGAKPSNRPFKPVALLPKTTETLRQGGTITLDEVPEEWKHLKIFLDEQSLPFVFYISDQNWLTRVGIRYKPRVDSVYKFHFKWCQALVNMKAKGRISRYRAKYDICNPAFAINDGHQEAILKVCKWCCSSFPAVHEYFGTNQWNIEDKFRMPEFFEQFGKIDLPPSTHPGGRDGYTRDWPRVARREKEKAQWRCLDCGEDCSHNKHQLHVHHKTGVKSDNVSDNLEVVCRACHAQKPGHEHMRS